ncbi:hypothetical protein [Streptomyces globisporus]|uniref:hypothetical protein n=1 Tax=Streptomyces globisporus TaxID=1908 RepID=UPI003818B024
MKKRATWSWQARRELSQYIQNAYGEKDAPRRSFAAVALRCHPYQDLVNDLAGVASIQDDTDINCDVCFSYILESQRLHLVRLSMVGPYATFARVGKSGSVEFIFPNKPGLSEIESSVIRLLEKRGFRILSEEQLAADADLALPDIQNVKVYNALFSPEEEFFLTK